MACLFLSGLVLQIVGCRLFFFSLNLSVQYNSEFIHGIIPLTLSMR